MRLFRPSPLPVPFAVNPRTLMTRPSAVVRLRNPEALKTMRNAVNERAKNISAPEQRRLQAVSTGLQELQQGSSTAWAITAAMRCLRGDTAPPQGHTPRFA